VWELTAFFILQNMDFNIKTLENSVVRLEPLLATDFERLFAVAADPLIWEQHPTKTRYKREIFEQYFAGALESQTAFCIFDSQNNELIGSSRFYDYIPNKSIVIGYTFFARACWGKGYNFNAKKLMLDYAFELVEEVIFHVGAQNIRSQKAIEKLGATKFKEQAIYYKNETTANSNFFYKINKMNWLEQSR